MANFKRTRRRAHRVVKSPRLARKSTLLQKTPRYIKKLHATVFKALAEMYRNTLYVSKLIITAKTHSNLMRNTFKCAYNTLEKNENQRAIKQFVHTLTYDKCPLEFGMCVTNHANQSFK